MTPAVLAAKPPARLLAALAALAAVALLLAGLELTTRRWLPARMAAFATRMSPPKLSGNALQTRAFQTPDLLPIFGSSELNRTAGNRPDLFFRRRPAGFTAFPIGRGGNSCFIILQKIAGTAAAARGGKIAVFLSPSWFLKTGVTEGAVRGNLAPLQLGGWVFRSELSAALRGRLARRLLDFPRALERQPLLAAGVAALASGGGGADRCRLAVLTPLGRAQDFLLTRLDYCAVLREMIFFQNQNQLRALDAAPAPGPGEALDWDRLAAEAQAQDLARGTETAYSVGLPPEDNHPHVSKRAGQDLATDEPEDEDDEAADLPPPPPTGRDKHAKPPRDRDQDFCREVATSREWADLALLIDVLKELRIDALFLSQPLNGIYRDQNGVSEAARQAYYTKLHAAIDPSGYPLRDFAEHEQDKYFFNDPGHPSSKAWIFYDRALTEFRAAKR